MKRYIVISAVGKDQPGLVNRISHEIKAAGGNVEMQRSILMADEYALLILFSLPGDASEAIKRLTGLSGQDLTVNAREAVTGAAGRPAGARLAELEASGADQPGIIDALTLLLFKQGINIESLDFDTECAPFTGDHLFRMQARLALPPAVKLEQLREQLRDMEQRYNFDILFRCPVG